MMLRLNDLLLSKFNYTSFKAGQEETIKSVLTKGATLSILPTGTGKSLCYQLASYTLPGITLIVSPLVSLMEDQVQQMQQQGEKRAVAFNSQLNFQEKEWVLANIHLYKFIFISPEMLFQETIRRQITRLPISLFVVDEAHCISQWGLDFRPEYERLYQIIGELPRPKILALTATATPNVTADIQQKLFKGQEAEVIRRSVERENIAYQVVETDDKLAFLINYFKEQSGFGIIYFSSKKESEEISARLNESTDLRVAFYHGDLTTQERSLIQQQALNDQLDILCATSAFGMGVNKKNVRHVLHYHLPSSIEAYLQESGRAGRDGQQSLATLLYQRGDEHIHYFLQSELTTAKINLAQLVNKSAAELNASLDEFDELTGKWIQGFIEGFYSLAELTEALDLKQREKVIQLNALLAYKKTKTCRREFLLAYFSEVCLQKPDYCCDNCGSSPPVFTKAAPKELEKLKFAKNWQENLKKLFISDN